MILQTPEYGENTGLQVKVKTPPAVEPVVLADVTAVLKPPTTDDNAMLTTLIASARRQAELYTGRSFINQVLLAEWDTYSSRGVELPYGPHGVIVEVNRVYEGELTALTSTDYYEKGLLEKTIVPNTAYKLSLGRYQYGLRVEYNAGYGATAADVPEPIKEAIIQIAINNYEHRRDVITGTTLAVIPNSAKEKLKPFKSDPHGWA